MIPTLMARPYGEQTCTYDKVLGLQWPRVREKVAQAANGFPNLEAVANRLERFERRYEAVAKPFEWKFTPL
jgi:hypothetical protein